MDDTIAFVQPSTDGVLQVNVNFGILAGRTATAAELEDLGHRLLAETGEVSVISEERFELSRHSEAEVHQVRIEMASLDEALRDRVVETAERWARACAADRHLEL